MFDFLSRKGQGGSKTQPVAVQRKSYAGGPVAAVTSVSRAAWGARDHVSLTRSGFSANPIGFRAVKLIAEAAASVPSVLQDKERRYDSHPILSLMTRPNRTQSQAAFLEALYSQLLLSGNVYVEAMMVGDALEELHVLRSERMRILPDANGWPAAFEYNVNGKKRRYNIVDGLSHICHIKHFHPQDDHYGMSILQAAANAIDVHNSASKWSKALLDNAARPSGAIVYRGSEGQSQLSQDQYERLLDEMETQHQGARNAGRPMLLEGGLDWKPMGFSPSDMEFQKTKEAAAREIAIAFGVPPMLLGIPGDATYANYQEANRAFYRLTVLPLCNKVMGSLSNWFSDFNGETVELRADLDQIPALASEREAQWRRIGSAAFLTDAEKRNLLGLPILEVGDGE